jgi:hypothetical protein
MPKAGCYRFISLGNALLYEWKRSEVPVPSLFFVKCRDHSHLKGKEMAYHYEHQTRDIF